MMTMSDDAEDLSDAIEKLRLFFTSTTWATVREYGDVNSDEYTCKRLKYYMNPGAKQNNVLRKYGINWGGTKLDAYQAKFVIYNECIPSNGMTISHICGLPKIRGGHSVCLEEEHMKEEPSDINNERRTCHMLIRLYYNKYYRRINLGTGPIYLTSWSKQDKYEFAIKKMKLSKRGARAIKRWKCNHEPLCFINYGEI